MNTVISSPTFLVAVIGGFALLYFLPSLIAVIRNVECIAFVTILNTLPVAWSAALPAACLLPSKDGWSFRARGSDNHTGCPGFSLEGGRVHGSGQRR